MEVSFFPLASVTGAALLPFLKLDFNICCVLRNCGEPRQQSAQPWLVHVSVLNLSNKGVGHKCK